MALLCVAVICIVTLRPFTCYMVVDTSDGFFFHPCSTWPDFPVSRLARLLLSLWY